jgi:hypothetical protein
MADTGCQADLLVVGQQAENHLVVAMLFDCLQKHLEKLVNGPGLVNPLSTYSSNEIAMSLSPLAIPSSVTLVLQVVSRCSESTSFIRLTQKPRAAPYYVLCDRPP